MDIIPFGDWLKEAGHSQNGFAKLIGVPKQSVSHWVRGKHIPASKMLRRLIHMSEGRLGLDSFHSDHGG